MSEFDNVKASVYMDDTDRVWLLLNAGDENEISIACECSDEPYKKLVLILDTFRNRFNAYNSLTKERDELKEESETAQDTIRRERELRETFDRGHVPSGAIVKCLSDKFKELQARIEELEKGQPVYIDPLSEEFIIPDEMRVVCQQSGKPYEVIPLIEKSSKWVTVDDTDLHFHSTEQEALEALKEHGEQS